MKQQQYKWRTREVLRPTVDSVTIVFDTGGMAFSYQPGQFINITFSINGEDFVRSYSLSSTPAIDRDPAITIKAIEDGRISNFLVRYAEHVPEWLVEGPFGSFSVDRNQPPASRFVFIAAGSGITPIYSIIRSLLLSEGVTMTLLYSNKLPETALFRKELLSIQAGNVDRFALQWIWTAPGAEKMEVEGDHYYGRLKGIVCRKILKRYLTAPDTAVFVCGPEGLIQTVLQACEKVGFDPSAVYFERFVPAVARQVPGLPDHPLEILFHFHERSVLLSVASGKSLLQAALDEGYEVPYSCKGGTCGRCKGHRIAGEVLMQQNFALSPEEVSENQILLCQSFPLDDRVIVAVE